MRIETTKPIKAPLHGTILKNTVTCIYGRVMGDAVTPNMPLEAGTVLATFDRATGVYGNGEPHTGSHTVVFLRWQTINDVVGMVVAQQMAGCQGHAELGWTTLLRKRWRVQRGADTHGGTATQKVHVGG